MRCPTCDKPVAQPDAKPFCSETCRRLDLGCWLDGVYRIPGAYVDPDLIPELQRRDREGDA
ncbi:MAG: DNA gyrase inhibitor YacG [Myxococcota bacterium]